MERPFSILTFGQAIEVESLGGNKLNVTDKSDSLSAKSIN